MQILYYSYKYATIYVQCNKILYFIKNSYSFNVNTRCKLKLNIDFHTVYNTILQIISKPISIKGP